MSIVSTAEFTIVNIYDSFNPRITSTNGFTFESKVFFKTQLQAHLFLGDKESVIEGQYICRWFTQKENDWVMFGNGESIDIDSSFFSLDVTPIKFQIAKESAFELETLNGTKVETISGDSISISSIDDATIIESQEIDIVKYYNGEKGEDGYTPKLGIDYNEYRIFIRWSDFEDGHDMYEYQNTSSSYMGILNTTLITPPNDYKMYSWVKVKGEDGVGIDGTSNFIHTKYSNDGMTFTPNNGEDEGNWLGICVNENKEDSMIFSDYKWKKIVGKDGTDGKNSYTWIKYSASSDGTNLSDNVNTYIGIYCGASSNAPTDKTMYKWSKFLSVDGQNAPNVLAQYSNDNLSWHDGFKSEDLYIKFSYDGGITYGIGMKIIGADGNDGVSIISLTTYFAIGTDKMATGEWTKFQPSRNEGQYLWRKDLISYSSGSSEYTAPYIVSGIDAESPYHVMLDNENESFSCGYNGSILSAITETINITVLKGNEKITEYAIGSIVSPSGINVTKTSTTVSINVLPGTNMLDHGTINIPIIVDGITFNKVFSYSKVYNGNPGENVLYASLTNDSCVVSTDSDGNNGNFANCYTSMHVYEGINDISDNFIFTAIPVGVKGAFDSSDKNKYIISGFTGETENAYVDIAAKKTGSQVLTKRFAVSMSKSGLTPLSYSISTNAQIIKQSQQGTLTPSSIRFALNKTVGSISMETNGYYKVYEYIGNALVQKATGYNKYVEFALSPDIEYVKCDFYEDLEYTKLLDSQTVPYVYDGIDALRFLIKSSKGTIFEKGTLFETSLTCIIYKGDKEIDKEGLYTYRWSRMNEKTSQYETFDYGKTISETQDGFELSDEIVVQFGDKESSILTDKMLAPVTTISGSQISIETL